MISMFLLFWLFSRSVFFFFKFSKFLFKKKSLVSIFHLFFVLFFSFFCVFFAVYRFCFANFFLGKFFFKIMFHFLLFSFLPALKKNLTLFVFLISCSSSISFHFSFFCFSSPISFFNFFRPKRQEKHWNMFFKKNPFFQKRNKEMSLQSAS